MYECIKKNKRLWIRALDSGELVYTPPNFIKLQSREPMHELASRFSEAGKYDVQSIIDFEVKYGPKPRKVQD